MGINVQNIIDRLIAIEKEALTALSPSVTADAVDYFFHAQETFPYFTHRIGLVTVNHDSETLDEYTVQIICRLVIGHVTTGYTGQSDGKLYTYIPQLLDTFGRRTWLQSATYTTATPYLDYAQCTNVTGFSVFRNTGINAEQIGTEFTITAVLRSNVEQDYL